MRKTYLFVVLLILLSVVIFLARPQLDNKTTNNQQQKQQITNPNSLSDEKAFSIDIFAQNLAKARDLEFSEDGTLLLSIPDQGRIVALPDQDNDGKADSVITVVDGLRWPHGLAFYNNKLFVAAEDKVARFNWNEQNKQANLDKVLFSLPTGGNHHSYTLTFKSDGQLFVALGSTCNVCSETHPFRATVIVSNENGDNPKVFANGLRNAPFIIINPTTNELWGTEMGRDWLGDNAPPDEINIIREGKHYGWPYCYGNKITDNSFREGKIVTCEDTKSPIFDIPAHSAPLGLTFINSPLLPEKWQGDLLVSYHGSWNRSVPTGYKVVRLDVENNKILKEYDFMTEFPKTSGGRNRPVDIIFDKTGNLYISDDEQGIVYRVTKQ